LGAGVKVTMHRGCPWVSSIDAEPGGIQRVGRLVRRWAVLLLVSVGLGATAARAASRPSKIDFSTHIRPMLNAHCTHCHGGVKMAGDISFVFQQEAMPAIKPGNPDGSELIRRIISDDLDYRMPPADHAAALSAAEVALFRQWIAEGARWSEHWAFVPPVMPQLPSVRPAARVRGPIDRFILARLEKENLSFSPEADRATLMRRASLDLIGLPPTPAELDDFLADGSPSAFERQVDRLLASPHFGERWASPWMDLARYADTKGLKPISNVPCGNTATG